MYFLSALQSAIAPVREKKCSHANEIGKNNRLGNLSDDNPQIELNTQAQPEQTRQQQATCPSLPKSRSLSGMRCRSLRLEKRAFLEGRLKMLHQSLEC
jgi:hypothetical protein